jgi:hypothetical protein
MTTERDRVLSVTLTEAEWRAFVARHPHPVRWLREQILSQLKTTPQPPDTRESADQRA